MLLKPIECSLAQSGKKTSENETRRWLCWEACFQRLPSEMDRFKSCKVQGLVLGTFKPHRLVWFGLVRGSLLIFLEIIQNFQEDAPVDAVCFMHLRWFIKTGFAALLFNQSC